MIDKGVYKKSKKGFLLTTISNIVRGGLGFLTLLVLTYFLGVEKLGVVSILMVIYGLSETLVQFGISQSIISRDKTTREELTSIFWANLFIGFFVFILVNLLATHIANFYEQPDIVIYIRILSFVFLIEPLELIFRAILEKNLEFPSLEKVNIVKYASLSVATIILAIIGFDIFSYIYGIIISVLITIFCFVFVFAKNKLWFPSFHFSLEEIKAHYSFGFYVSAKSFLNYAGRNFDELIVGRVLGMEVLGIYYFAKKVVEKPLQLLTGSFAKVSFPMFATLKNRVEKLRKAYFNLTHVIASFGFLIFGGLVVFAPIFIPIIFGNEWDESIFLIQAFSVIALLDLLSAGFSSAVLYVFNKPSFVMKVDLFLTPLRLLLIYIASLFSIEMVLLAFFFVVLIKVFTLQNKANFYLETNFKKYILNIKRPIQNLSLSFLLYFIFSAFFESLIIPSVVFVVVYIILLMLREKETIISFKNELFKKNEQ